MWALEPVCFGSNLSYAPCQLCDLGQGTKLPYLENVDDDISYPAYQGYCED